MRGRIGLPALLLLGACAGGSAPRTAGAAAVPSDAVVKIGAPYEVNGTRYVPADDRFYDALGQASLYGAESGARTANGEAHDSRGYGAAHPTLPLPSYVEVTSLATGRTIVVRVNDRGPFARGRLIDLSPPAARALGIDGTAAVRVRRVFPSEAERAALRLGQAAPARLPASPQLLAALRARLAAGGGVAVRLAAGPMPAAPEGAAAAVASVAASDATVAAGARSDGADHRGSAAAAGGDAGVGDGAGGAAPGYPGSRPTRPAAAATARPVRAAPGPAAAPPASRPSAAPAHGIFVQVGAFGDGTRAAKLAAELGGRVSAAGALRRVRVGPFASDAAAKDALAKLRAQGYGGAAIVRE